MKGKLLIILVSILAASLLVSLGYAAQITTVQVPLASSLPYDVRITVNLYSSPRTFVASKNITYLRGSACVSADFSSYNIDQATLNNPYVELVSHLIAGDRRVYLSYLAPSPTCAICGNNFCDLGETCVSCPGDCGTCPVPTVDIKANNQDNPTITSGSQVTLAWTSTRTSSCTASNAWSGFRSTAGSEFKGTLTASKTYALTCTGTGGSASDSTTVTVIPAPSCGDFTCNGPETCLSCPGDCTVCPPDTTCGDNTCESGKGETCSLCSLDCGSCPGTPNVDIKANSQDSLTVASGSSATLSWTSINVDSCTASGAWSGAKPTSGSQATGAITTSQTYTLVCTGPGGSDADSVVINVVGPPTVDLKANNQDSLTVASGSSATLSWSSTNADSCSASGAWGGSRPASGSEATAPITTAQTYSLSCTGIAGTATDSVTVSVACADGTAPGQCSTANPGAFCENGNLVIKPNQCGACSDSTLPNTCSTTKPQLCQGGSLVSSCQQCGCPAGDICRANGTCAAPFCGDNVCSGTETCSACSQDCGACPAGYFSLTCKSGWQKIDELCVTDCDDDCEKRYDSTYGTGNVRSVYDGCCGGLHIGGKCFFQHDTCRCDATITTSVACSLNPSCPAGNTLVTQTACSPPCTDGTASGQCSSTKPKFCDNGNLIDKASVCGCPPGYAANGDICDPVLTASCSVSPTTAITGQAVTWSATPSGGTGAYSYAWSGTDGLSGTAQSVSKSYATTGTKTGSVAVTSGSQTVSAACGSVIVSQPPATCGNVIVETGEECDGTNLNGKTCTDLGFGGGTLSCGSNCKFNTANCLVACADGTAPGQCSTNKPKYCDTGNLIDKASVCGCPPTYVQSGETCVKKAVLSSQITRGPTCTPEDPGHSVCGGLPPGENVYYYNTRISETNGVTVTLNQKCWTFAACGPFPSSTDCKDGTYIRDVFGSNTIPAGGSFTFQDEAVRTQCSSNDITETYSGTDSNGNSVSVTFSFRITGCSGCI